MIVNFNNFLNESLSFEKISGETVSIDLNDYKTIYENIFNKNYRNLENGDVFHLNDIFKGMVSILLNGELKTINESYTSVNLLKTKSNNFYLEFITIYPRIKIERVKTNGIIEIYDMEKYRIDFYKKFLEIKPRIIEGYDLKGNKIIVDIKSDYKIELNFLNNVVSIYAIHKDNDHYSYSNKYLLTIKKPIIGKFFRYHNPIDPFGEEIWEKLAFENLNEKLGVSESVQGMTDIIWEKYKNAPEDKTFIMEDIESGDFKIKRLEIKNYYNENSTTWMTFLWKSKLNENGDYYVYMSNNTVWKKEKSCLNHELLHAYEYLKKGYNERSYGEDVEYFGNMETDEELLKELLFIMYCLDLNEIRAFYNESIIFIKENKSRFRRFKDILKHCSLGWRYNMIKEFDIEKLRENENIETFIKVYYEIRREQKNISNPKGYKNKFEYYKNLFLTFFELNKEKDIKITKNEIDAFIRKFKEEIEYKKRIYIKYIGRLKTEVGY